jgi:phage terminase small subunit
MESVVLPAPALMSDDRSPGCPGDLDTDAKAVWRKTKAYMKERGDWNDIYAHTLSLMARAEMRGRLARKTLVDPQGRSIFTTTGSQGQDVPHPNIKTAREAERDLLEYLRALRLTPQELAKAGGEVAKPPTTKFGGRLGAAA